MMDVYGDMAIWQYGDMATIWQQYGNKQNV
jgi:hypothetical protein